MSRVHLPVCTSSTRFAVGGLNPSTDRATSLPDAQMGRFQSEKLGDFKRIVMDFISLQIDHSAKIQQAWRDLLPRLEEIESGPPRSPRGGGLAVVD